MNSGKTTLLRALAAEISPRERIVTIEQAFELGLDTVPERHPDMVALEARPANVEGVGLISVADLVRRALRMNADRVVVGEVLGDEVLPMLNAMSQGRSGLDVHDPRRLLRGGLQADCFLCGTGSGAVASRGEQPSDCRRHPLRRPSRQRDPGGPLDFQMIRDLQVG